MGKGRGEGKKEREDREMREISIIAQTIRVTKRTHTHAHAHHLLARCIYHLPTPTYPNDIHDRPLRFLIQANGAHSHTRSDAIDHEFSQPPTMNETPASK